MKNKIIIISLAVIILLMLILISVKQLKIDNNEENFIINNSNSASWEISTENIKYSWAWDIN
jgi:hypothetical protein